MDDDERKARAMAAAKMGLVKDPDGSKLPDEIWMQALPPTTLVGMVLGLRDDLFVAETRLERMGWEPSEAEQGLIPIPNGYQEI